MGSRQFNPILEQLSGTKLQTGYVLQAKVHTSHMSVLYKGLDLSSQQDVAIKLLLHVRHLDRFENEARLADKIQHPNIVKTLRYQITGEQVEEHNLTLYYIIMRWLTQDSLENIINKRNADQYFWVKVPARYANGQTDRTLDAKLGVAATVLYKLSGAFDYLHQSLHIINRDVKPSNIQYSNGEPFLLDFGIAKVIRSSDATLADADDSGLTSVGEMPGTSRYMAPEQWTHGSLSGATDQYQLALTIYELLADGVSPYDKFRQQLSRDTSFSGVTGATRAQIRREIWSRAHVNQPPTSLDVHVPNMPIAVWNVLRRALRKLPGERYPTVTEFAYDFARALPSEIQSSLPSVPGMKPLNLTPSPSGLSDPVNRRPSSRPSAASAETYATYSGPMIATSMGINAPPPAPTQPPPVAPSKPDRRGLYAAVAALVIVALLAIGIVIAVAISGDDNTSSASDNGDNGIINLDDNTNTDDNGDDAEGNAANNGSNDEIVADSEPTATETLVPEPTEVVIVNTDTPEPTDTDVPTNTPSATATPTPTFTSTPTATPTPTATLTPSATLTPTPRPLPAALLFVSDRDGSADVFLSFDGETEWRPIANTGNVEHQPIWSKDGRRVAYSSGVDTDFDIFVYEVNSNTTELVVESDAIDAWPSFSPDGSRLIFTSTRTDNFEVFILDLNSGGSLNLSNHPADDFLGDWSLDNTQIVFVSNRDGDNELFVMNPSGGDVQQLTFNDSDDSYPRWSPDGSQIVYHSNVTGNYEIYAYDVATAESTQLTSLNATSSSPVFTEDGSEIVFWTDRNGSRDVYVVPADGSDAPRAILGLSSSDEQDAARRPTRP